MEELSMPTKRAILEAAWVLRKQGFSLDEAVDRALRDAGYRGGPKGEPPKKPPVQRKGPRA